MAWAVAVRTEIEKRPVTDPVPRDGSVSTGDGQADLVGHGGEYRAVLVCQRPAYRHGSQELGRSDLTPGIFGENLTVYGPEDDEVCTRDRLPIGGDLRMPTPFRRLRVLHVQLAFSASSSAWKSLSCRRSEAISMTARIAFSSV